MQIHNKTISLYGVLLLLGIALLGVNLNGYDLTKTTEPRVAGITAEMLISGDYVVPKLSGTPFLEKPPFSVWLESFAMRYFGINAAAARLPSVLAGLITAFFLMFGVHRLGFSLRRGFITALLLLTMGQFWANARMASEDMLVTCGIAISLLSFFIATEKKAYIFWCVYAFGLTVATLSKGVVGLAIPGVVIAVYLIALTFFIDKKFVLQQWFLPALFAFFALLPLMLWLFFLHQNLGWSAVYDVVWGNSVGRFSGDFAGDAHNEPFYYYLKKLPELFLPWTLLVVFAGWQQYKHGQSDRTGFFYSCWLVVTFILLSISSGKRQVYLVYCYPAAALLAAHHFDALLLRTKPIYTRVSVAVMLLVIGSYIIFAQYFLPNQDKKSSLRPLFESAQKLREQGYQLILFQPSEKVAGASTFYLHDILPVEMDSNMLTRNLQQNPKTMGLVAGDTFNVDQLQVLARFEDHRRSYYLVGKKPTANQ